MSEQLSDPYETTPVPTVDVREYIPGLSEADAERVDLLFQLVDTEHRGGGMGLSWAMDYAVTHPYTLAQTLRDTEGESPHLLIETVPVFDRQPETAFVTRAALLVAQDIQTCGILHRISANRFAHPGVQQLSEVAHEALEADIDYRILRSSYYIESNDPVAFRRFQNAMLLTLARHAASRSAGE